MTVRMLDLAAQRAAMEPGLRGAIDRVLDHGAYVLGPEVDELEAALGVWAGAETVTCANGTDALVLALRALGLDAGDRVVVPAFTFAATAEAVVLAGGSPVFADIRADTFNLDVDGLASAIGTLDGPPPVGVIVVDLFGQPADHDALDAVARRHGWWVITDAAQSFGSSSAGRPTGGLGTVATTSFFPSKPLGCFGDGGAVFSPGGTYTDLLRSLRNHGAGSDRYENVRIGINSRLDTLQAAVLLEKLRLLRGELDRREELAERYSRELAGSVAVAPIVLPGNRSAWAQYTIRVPKRPAVLEALTDAGVQHAVHYRTTVADQPAYALRPALGALPVARAACAEVVSLPLHPYLTDLDQDRVLEAVHLGLKAS